VRTLGAPHAPAGPPEIAEPLVDPELAALRLEAAALAQQLHQREGEIDQLKRDVDAAFIDGEAEGRAAGLAEADDGAAKRLAALEAGVGQASTLFSEQMAGLEQLAILLAHEGLAKILDDRSAYCDLLSGVIRTQLDRLEAEAVVCVQVARADFPDADRLAALTAQVARPGLDINASEDLAAGDCRIRLRLGALEIGVARQWSRLGAALRALIDTGDGE
jgi:type III secretion protein L